MVDTKYLRQIATARRIITAKGTVCSWWKAANTDDSDDIAPEFPTYDNAVEHAGVPIVFYPQRNLRFVTQERITITGEVSNALYALIPGDVDFTPVEGDKVTCKDQTLTVATVNTTQPDMVPICHELSFK